MFFSLKENTLFRLSALSLALFSSFSFAADEAELNLDFLRGVTSAPSVLKSNSAYPAGQYMVDVIVNQESMGKMPLTISQLEDENNALCLSAEWLKKANIPLRLDGYAKAFNADRQCYILAKEPYTKVDFRYGTQSLVFSIPQSLTQGKADPSRWDYGVQAARLKYQTSVSRSTGQSTSVYASGELLLNVGRWVLSSNMNGNRNSDGIPDFSVRDATLSTAISQVKGDLLLGKSWTRSRLFNAFGFYGAALRSNSNMTPWESQGYAPLISGVASTASRITIKQSGYTIYSKMVPPGPYQLDDVRAVGNGDLEVTVEDEGGHKTVTTYPVTTLPTLLRPGEVEYDVAAGRKSSNSKIKAPFSGGEEGMFWMGSLGYGLASTTLNAASVLHGKYQAGGVSVTRSLGSLGSFSAGANLSFARYDDGMKKTGHSVSAKYAKSISDSSDLQLLAYQYQSNGYVEFSDYYSNDPYRSYNKKSRYEMNFTQRFSDISVALSGWTENYWYMKGNATGMDASISASLFGDVSTYLLGGYSKRPYQERPDYNVSLNVSVPFTVGNTSYYNNTGYSYSRDGKSSLSNTVGASPTDRLSYSLNTHLSEKGEHSVGGNISYGFDAMQTNAVLTQGRHNTSVSGSVSGTILGTADSGLLMTKEYSDTLGVVRIPDVAGVRVNGSAPTNSKGYTVVNLSNYAQNTVSVDVENVPDSLELKTTSYNVVPTEKAVVFREFGAEYMQRYILQLKDRNGNVIRGGNARTEQGLDAGFIAGNGVLLMNVLSAPSEVTVTDGGGMTCRFSVKGIQANTNKVKEVRCE